MSIVVDIFFDRRNQRLDFEIEPHDRREELFGRLAILSAKIIGTSPFCEEPPPWVRIPATGFWYPTRLAAALIPLLEAEGWTNVVIFGVRRP